MGRFYLPAILLLVTAVFISMMLAKSPDINGGHKTVVVELFTSEGCSSCPPADALLSHLHQDLSAKNIQVIPLGFHVDYWNSLGWKDRFSSSAFSQRQEQYARSMKLEGPYTPQMVVDGSAEFVGNNTSQANRVISQAAVQQELATVMVSTANSEQLSVQVKAQPSAEEAAVLLAITEDNLVTKVGSGENADRTLHHSAVVRTLRELGQLHNGSFEASLPLKLNKEWKQNDLHAVVFVQQGSGGKILGAASVALASATR